MVNKNTKVTYGISTGNHSFADNGKAEDENDILSDIAKVDYNFGGGDWTLSVGRTDKYVIGGSKGYGYNYGDIFDRAELKYSGDSFMATAGYGKFKAGGVAGDNDLNLDGTKTAYGVIEGRFGNGTAIGGYYNTFDNDDYNALVRGTELDYLWGAYASFNFSKDWNLLANYERVNYNSNISTSKVRSDEDSATVWIGRLTYGKAVMATPKTWDAWLNTSMLKTAHTSAVPPTPGDGANWITSNLGVPASTTPSRKTLSSRSCSPSLRKLKTATAAIRKNRRVLSSYSHSNPSSSRNLQRPLRNGWSFFCGYGPR